MRPFLLAWLCLIFFTAAQAQAVRSTNLIKEVLELPAPPPVNAESEQKKRDRPPEFYAPENIPADDAPLEDLLDYWEAQNRAYDEFRYNQTPSPETVKRILGEIEKDPSLLPGYLKLLPAAPDTVDLVKRIYETEKQTKISEGNLFAVTRVWLRSNSDLFIDELTESARSVKADGRSIAQQEDLISLAQVDWDRARPIIDRLENNPQETELYTLAKYVLYHRALKEENSADSERYREDLKKLVENKKGSHKTRDLAMDALVLGGNFAGRDDWYLSLLEDETLLELQENGYTGLTTLVRFLPNERDKWLPAMLRLLDSGRPALRSAAVRNISQIGGLRRPEVLKKLLPWLTDPGWAQGTRENERNDFIVALGEIEIPESVPGLIALVSNPADEQRTAAARALVKYKSVEAVGVLRRMLLTEENYELRASLIQALVELGGFSDEELLNGLEASIVYALAEQKRRAAREDDESEREDEKPIPVEVSIGLYLREYETPTDGLVGRTIRRIRELRKPAPEVARVMIAIMENWDHPLVDLEMLGWMSSEKANPETVLKLLAKRAELRARVAGELAAMRGQSGLMRGLGSVILDDRTDLFNILKSTDSETVAATLAFARLVRVSLPVDEIAPLLKNPDKLVATAAERYLEAEDGVAARTLLLAQFKSETRILGARQGFAPEARRDFESLQPLLNNLFQTVSGSYFYNPELAGLRQTEQNLRREMAANPELLGVFGFVLDRSPSSRIVRLYRDKIVFTYYEDAARYWEKALDPKEFEALTRFLIDRKIDQLTPISSEFNDEAPAGEFLMFGRDGGRRVFYQSYSMPKNLGDLEEMFESFNSGERRLRYRLADKINGLEVLTADENLSARIVWKNKSDLRVLVADELLKKSISEEIGEQEKLDENDRLAGRDLYRRQKERREEAAFKHYSWRGFANDKFGAEKIEEPAAVRFLNNSRETLARVNFYAAFPTPSVFRRETGDGEIIIEDGGLYKLSRAGGKTLFKEGSYANPVVSPDKKWVIAAKADNGFYSPNGVVRIDLQTGREFPVNLPPADEFYPVVPLSALNKVLLFRAKDGDYPKRRSNPSPPTPEYYVLDPNTGAAQPVKGEFRPLEQSTFRTLQPAAAAPNEFWAAIYNEREKTTEIGSYSAVNFSFKPLLRLPEIELDSMDIWVDEPAAKIYFVYQGHLLAVPLGGK